ncbi:MAG: GGDEF domain-containing protein [Anaerolineales bacterium]|jgi:diguanylate cyclase (GGDEF)-like protein
MAVFEDTTFNNLSDQALATELSQENPVLLVLNGSALGKRFLLDEASLIIGRDPDSANIVLMDRAVSAMHTRIDYNAREKRYFITDLGSKNGVWINSRRIDSSPLSPGDKIFLGATALKFNIEDAIEERFHSQVDTLMNIDDLTGLPIKRAFDQRFSIAFVKARQRHKPLSLLMMDMDGLKQINDTYGHLLGSHTIAECGSIIGEAVGKRGTACRYGGDEYMAYLRNNPLVEALPLGEYIRQTIAGHRFQLNGQRVHPTISIGVAELCDEMQTPNELVNAADEALYRAKEAGRNIVCR